MYILAFIILFIKLFLFALGKYDPLFSFFFLVEKASRYAKEAII